MGPYSSQDLSTEKKLPGTTFLLSQQSSVSLSFIMHMNSQYKQFYQGYGVQWLYSVLCWNIKKLKSCIIIYCNYYTLLWCVCFLHTDKPLQTSWVPVYVRLLDVNDNAPKFASFYETFVCEKTKAGQVQNTDPPLTSHDRITWFEYSSCYNYVHILVTSRGATIGTVYAQEYPCM